MTDLHVPGVANWGADKAYGEAGQEMVKAWGELMRHGESKGEVEVKRQSTVKEGFWHFGEILQRPEHKGRGWVRSGTGEYFGAHQIVVRVMKDGYAGAVYPGPLVRAFLHEKLLTDPEDMVFHDFGSNPTCGYYYGDKELMEVAERGSIYTSRFTMDELPIEDVVPDLKLALSRLPEAATVEQLGLSL